MVQKGKKQYIIEVKGFYTFASKAHTFNNNKRKYLAASKQGYAYRIWVFDEEGKRMKLPKQWYNMSYNGFMEQFRIKEYLVA